MSCCGSLFVNLGGGGGGTVNTGVLQIAGGVPLDSTLRFVEDQNGTDSPLQLSTTRASIVLPDCSEPFTFGRFNASINSFNGIGFDSGTVYPFFNMQGFISGVNRFRLGTNGFVLGETDAHTQNGFLSVKGAGANIASFRDSTNVEKASIDNSGQVSATNIIASNAGIFDGSSLYRAIDTGSINIYNGGSATAGIEIYGSTNATTFLRNKILAKTSFIGLGEINSATAPAIKRNTENIDFRLSNDNGYCGITAGRSTEKTLEVLEVSGAMGLGFFNTPAINQPVTGGASATYANVSGTEIKENDTFDGYTVGGVVKALRNLGLLA
jgi:hypothetical protein